MTNLTSTPLPCPEWCSWPDGHRFESEDDAGVVYRYHVREVRQMSTAAGGPSAVIVQVRAEESAAGHLGPVLDVHPPVVNVFGMDEGDDLTAAEARVIAAALLAAADELDRVEAS